MISVDVALALGSFPLEVAFGNDEGITALFGRSGAGKSTTINLIAGLAKPDRGHIALDDTILVDTERGIVVPPHRRQVGLVFQDAQLFPHLSVRQNLLYGRWFASPKNESVSFASVVETLGISHLLKRKPSGLSGGEKQRVALGRALLASPKLLLMDEPLASLDMERKLEILPLIERLRDEFHIPIVYVSHSLDEVARLASRVVVMEQGRVIAIGGADDALGPGLRDIGISRFERSSVVTGMLKGTDAYGLTEISHSAGTIWLTGRAGPVGREVRVVIKATDITLAKTEGEGLSVQTTLAGTIADVETDNGPVAGVTIALDGHGQLFALVTRKAIDSLGLGKGDRVFALVKAVALDERTVAAPQSPE
jgi:molybdate transport system ATP-binding protein